MKIWSDVLFENGLRQENTFGEKLEHNEAQYLKELMNMAHPFIIMRKNSFPFVTTWYR